MGNRAVIATKEKDIGTVVEILYRDFLPFVKSKALGVLKTTVMAGLV